MAGAPLGGAPAPRTSLTVVVLVGAPPPRGESTQESLIRWPNDGGGNGEKRIAFG
jgi:hypothetical protein